MKVKATRKEIVNTTAAAYLKKAGYCSMQYLLSGKSPAAYTCGVYGWNFDAYNVGPYTICTGYRNMPGQPVAEWETLDAYETAAEKIYNDYKRPYDERIAEIDGLLRDLLAGRPFVEAVKKAA